MPHGQAALPGNGRQASLPAGLPACRCQEGRSAFDRQGEQIKGRLTLCACPGRAGRWESSVLNDCHLLTFRPVLQQQASCRCAFE